MADVDRVIKALRQAAVYLRATHGRKGMMVDLKDADEVVVAGDLHGNLGNLRKILKLADLDANPARHLVLQEFVHGITRSPEGYCTSHQLLDIVAALKCQYPHRVHLLIGNHELAEWTDRAIAKDGVALNALFAAGVAAAFGDRAGEVTSLYHQFFASCALAVRTQNRVMMTHSIPPEKHLDEFDTGLFDLQIVPEDQRGKGSSLYWLLWGRDVSEEASRKFAELVDCDYLITGHIASEEGFNIPNSRQIVVDCVNHPAACVLFPAREPITFQQLVDGIMML